MNENPDLDFPFKMKGYVPQDFGVYAIIRIKDKRVIYIGESGNFQTRINNQHEGFIFAKKNRYSYYTSYDNNRSLNNEDNRRDLEEDHKVKFEPLYDIANSYIEPTGKYPAEKMLK